MVEGSLNPGTPTVVHAGYRASSISATRPAATELLVIDTASDTLLTQAPPNDGTLTNPRPLGVDIGSDGGFDIAGTGDEGFLVGTPGRAGGASLYGVDLTSGRATAVGQVGDGDLTLTGLAAAQNRGARPGRADRQGGVRRHADGSVEAQGALGVKLNLKRSHRAKQVKVRVRVTDDAGARTQRVVQV
jgi:hypothetical protein